MSETFTSAEIKHAIASFIGFGEQEFGRAHHGYYSGPGHAARALRFHLDQLCTPWSKDVPVTAGYYWFYGWPWGGPRHMRDEHGNITHEDVPTLRHVLVRGPLGCGGFAYIADGAFIEQSNANGIWLPCPAPELPSLPDDTHKT